jgi:hypothetical protein
LRKENVQLREQRDKDSLAAQGRAVELQSELAELKGELKDEIKCSAEVRAKLEGTISENDSMVRSLLKLTLLRRVVFLNSKSARMDS